MGFLSDKTREVIVCCSHHPQRAFYGWSSLTAVTIPSSVTSIGNKTFPYTCYVHGDGGSCQGPAGIEDTFPYSNHTTGEVAAFRALQ